MKKNLNLSFAYAIAALLLGAFYREFTKFNNFTGVTALGKVHSHLFVLGALIFLILALFSTHIDLTKYKHYKTFILSYNIGLVLMCLMMVIRGITQVLGLDISKGLSAAISGFAGIGHIILTVGMVFLYMILKQVSMQKAKK